MDLKAHLWSKAKEIENDIRSLRRRIHANPEPGYEEIETARLVAGHLGATGIEFRTGVARTGVLGELGGRRQGRTVLLRADMDALRKEEGLDSASRPHLSKNPGLMHACGHDGHVAILLGAARILHGLKEKFDGSIKFVFQPAEEGGKGGKMMVDEGVLENPDVGAAFALHAWPDIPVGGVGFQHGVSMAASSDFVLEFEGRSGHAAFPETCIDPVPAAAQTVGALQTIRSRELPPMRGAVVSVTILESGSRADPGAGPGVEPLLHSQSNIIPQVVRLTGTSRALCVEDQKSQLERIEEIAVNVGRAHRVGVSMALLKEYPPTLHDDAMTDLAARAACDLLGPDAVVWEKEPTMGGEDFRYFLQKVPGSFFRLGTGHWKTPLEREEEPGLHTDAFDFNDDALVTGMVLMAGVALEYLGAP